MLEPPLRSGFDFSRRLKAGLVEKDVRLIDFFLSSTRAHSDREVNIAFRLRRTLIHSLQKCIP